MNNDKSDFIEICPECKKYKIYELGKNQENNLILKCDNCKYIILKKDFKDLNKLKKECKFYWIDYRYTGRCNLTFGRCYFCKDFVKDEEEK